MTETNRKKILLIGLRSDCVDYSKWPQLTQDGLEAAFKQVLLELEQEGYRGVWCLTDRGETAARQIEDTLKSENPDIVLVGAGVRTDPGLFFLFEKAINLIHEHAPLARIAFNRLPYDSVEAVRRWG